MTSDIIEIDDLKQHLFSHRTADNRRAMLPVSEITQFPSVLVSLQGTASRIVDEFDTFVRPVLNPKLTSFSIGLTGITQADVHAAPILEKVIPAYLSWLQSHGLVDQAGKKIGHWAIATWSDADIGSQLAREAAYKKILLPECFRSWVDLKRTYKVGANLIDITNHACILGTNAKHEMGWNLLQCCRPTTSHFCVHGHHLQQHYGREATGGLAACVDRLGLKFEGRAHNGLIDSRNTAAIVLHMARGDMIHGAFVFRRTTRGLDDQGRMVGAPKHGGARANATSGKRRRVGGAQDKSSRHQKRKI